MAVGLRISIAESEDTSHGETLRNSKVVEVVGIVGRVDLCVSAVDDGEAFRMRDGTLYPLACDRLSLLSCDIRRRLEAGLGKPSLVSLLAFSKSEGEGSRIRPGAIMQALRSFKRCLFDRKRTVPDQSGRRSW